jgi:NAD(P)-dependent dehydrogenase (short-subunit alcohol dehydrogenase family)
MIERIADTGGKGLSLQADVTKPEDAANLVRTTVEEFGHHDFEVTSAGTKHKMPLLKTPLEVYNQLVAVNLTGPWLGRQEVTKRQWRKASLSRTSTSPPCTRVSPCRPTPRTAPARVACTC